MIKKSQFKIIDMLFLALFILVNQSFAFAQTASILPPAKTTFVDSNGKPLVSGTVTSYIPGTTTPKTTWQDAAETIPNANPLTLDSAGRALLLGSGSYRQIVKDRLNNIIWDQVTSSTGSGGGGGSTATGDGDLVGTIKPWAGMTAPNQYAFTYGQEISRSTFSVLFTAITSSQPAFCTSGSPTITGIGDTNNFWIGMFVEIPCIGAGFSTIISKTSSTVTLAVNANTNLSTTAIFFPWGRGNGTTTFNLPDFRGLIPAGNNIMGGIASANLTTGFFGAATPNASGAPGGNQSVTLGLTNLPANIISANASQAISVNPNAIPGTVVPYNGSGGSWGPALVGTGACCAAETSAGGTVAGTSTFSGPNSITVTSNNTGTAGAAVAFGLIQPTKTVNYIIKIIPDANSATASGVTSLGTMVGDIACGTGLLCTGNNISVTSVPLTLGTTTIVGGTNTKVLFDNNGSLGEYTISGTGNVAMSTSPILVTPALGVASATSLALGGASIGSNALALTGSSSIASSSATALTVGPNGSTNPVLTIVGSFPSQADGLNITGTASGNGVALQTNSPATNSQITINSKGTGTLFLQNSATGSINLGTPTTLSAALTYGGVTLNNAVTGTGNMVLSAAPTFSGTITGTYTLGGTPSVPTTGLTGVLQAAQEPAHTGDCTNSAGSLALACSVQGTWTPTIIGESTAGTGQTYSSQVGTYQKFGREVTAHFAITLTSLGTAAGNADIGGLPFTSSATGNVFGSCYIESYAINSNTGTGISGVISQSVTVVQLLSIGATSASQLTITNVGSTGILRGTCFYQSP